MKKGGITLIALVVTIVAIIILATVTLNIIFEENGEGIINSAYKLEEHKTNAESTIGSQISDLLNKTYIDVTDLKLSQIQESNINAKDSNGVKIVIPKGFKVRVDLGTKASEGIVIEDANGNQFVWVPCTVTGEQGLTPYAQDKKYNNGSQGNYEANYKAYTDWTDIGNVESVRENGGFYVARFEAGIPSTASFYPGAQNKYTTTGRDTDTVIPVSKAGSASWNYISQHNAVKVSSKMYEGNNSVESRLIDSYAWDTIVNWMAGSGVNVKDSTSYGNYINTTITANGLYVEHINNSDGTWTTSTNYGNGSITLGRDIVEGKNIYKEIATGASEKTKVKNIYDMAGNMWEWTTEKGRYNIVNGEEYVVRRGGGFINTGNASGTVPYRAGLDNDSNTYFAIGFRVVLYVVY